MAVFNCLRRLINGHMQIRNYSLNFIPEISKFIDLCTDLLSPKGVHICDGSLAEREILIEELMSQGTLVKLDLYHNCFIVRTDPRDTGRVESKTYTSAFGMGEWISYPAEGHPSQIGNFMSLSDAEQEINTRFKNVMRGRKMFVVPFILGPPKGSNPIVGIQVTDSALTAVLIGISSRVGKEAVESMCVDPSIHFFKGVHSMGKEENESKKDNNPWPCDPERFMLIHIPDKDEVWSYGSNWPTNAVLTRESMVLKLASARAKKEHWMAERMAVFGVQRKDDPSKIHYIGMMGPPGTGKSTMASLITNSKEYNVTIVSDDVSWLKPNAITKKLHATNPDKGMMSLVEGTNWTTSPGLMTATAANAIFFNVASTSTGGTFWQGMPRLPCDVEITDWKGTPWYDGTSPSHPNASVFIRMCQLASLDDSWDHPEGVPLSAILVATKRSEGVPLVYEFPSFKRGVFSLATLHSESYPTSEIPRGTLKPEPFGSGIYLGDSLGKYSNRWLDLQQLPNIKLPKMFGLNLFLKDSSGKFIWPGYSENLRILEWVVKRCEKCAKGEETPIGVFPNLEEFNACGLRVDLKTLFMFKKHFWQEELNRIEDFFRSQIPYDTPNALCAEIVCIKSEMDKSEKEEEKRKEKKAK